MPTSNLSQPMIRQAKLYRYELPMDSGVIVRQRASIPKVKVISSNCLKLTTTKNNKQNVSRLVNVRHYPRLAKKV